MAAIALILALVIRSRHATRAKAYPADATQLQTPLQAWRALHGLDASGALAAGEFVLAETDFGGLEFCGLSRSSLSTHTHTGIAYILYTVTLHNLTYR